MSLYSLYGEVSGDSVQILTEAPPCISKFGRPYRPSYVFDSPYMIPPFKKVRNIRPAPTLQIMDRDIDERTNVDINPLRGLEDLRGFDEFDQWFAGAITMDRTIRKSHKFFEILLGHDALGWLGDEVSFFKCCCKDSVCGNTSSSLSGTETSALKEVSVSTGGSRSW